MPPGMRRLGGGRVELTNAAGATMVTTEDAVPPELFSLPEPPPQAPLVPETALANAGGVGAPGSMFFGSAQQQVARDAPPTPTPTRQATATPQPSAPAGPTAEEIASSFDDGGSGGQVVLPQNTYLDQVYVPGGPRRTVRSGLSVATRPGVDIPNEAVAAVQDANEEGARAVLRIGDTESWRDKGLEQNLGQLSQRQRDMELDRRRAEGLRLAESNASRDEYLRALDGATSAVIDPDRRDTGQRVLSGIASFLDGLAGSTAVLETIQQSLQNDIRSQQQQIASGETRARGMQTSYEMGRQRMGDERAAEAAAMAFELEAAAREAERIGLMASSSTVRDRARVIASEMMRASLTWRAEMERARMGEMQTSEQFREVGGGGRYEDRLVTQDEHGTRVYRGPQGSLLQPGRMQAAGAAGMRLQDTVAGAPELDAGSESRVFASAQAAMSISDAVRELEEIDRLAARTRAAGPVGGRVPRVVAEALSADADALSRSQQSLINRIVGINRLAGERVNDSDVVRYSNEIPNLATMRDETRRQVVARIRSELLAKREQIVRAHSGVEAQELRRRMSGSSAVSGGR